MSFGGHSLIAKAMKGKNEIRFFINENQQDNSQFK